MCVWVESACVCVWCLMYLHVGLVLCNLVYMYMSVLMCVCIAVPPLLYYTYTLPYIIHAFLCVLHMPNLLALRAFIIEVVLKHLHPPTQIILRPGSQFDMQGLCLCLNPCHVGGGYLSLLLLCLCTVKTGSH